MTIQETAEAAKAAGMTYGEYVMKHSPPVTVTVPEEADKAQAPEEEQTPVGEPTAWTRACPQCGRTFYLKSEKSMRKYCSELCRENAQYERTMKRQLEQARQARAAPRGDPVNHPGHYNMGGLEAIEAACAGLDGFEGFCVGNAIKYEWRWKHKGGGEDLDKAIWYLKRLRSRLVKEADHGKKG